MNADIHLRLQDIVTRALESEGAQRLAFVRRECGDDQALLAQAERLLGFAESTTGAFRDDDILERRDQLEAVFHASEEIGDGWVPQAIGEYQVRRIIGRGGTGVVFEAEQAFPARPVALKLLHPSLATPESTKRLAQEADALGRLQHVGIAQIFEADTFDVGAGPQPYIAMELIDGFDLARHAHAFDLDRQARVELLIKVCAAVQHAHDRGVMHRDLKPDNILVGPDGEPKLLDFGIASLARDSAAQSLGLTVEGQLLGTLAYMAPEQATGEAADASESADARRLKGVLIDVYALGAVAFELITGRRPRLTEGLTITQMLEEVRSRDVPLARTVASSVEADLETILAKALASEPGQRYASAEALAADLHRFQSDLPIAARPPTAIDRARKFTRRNKTLVWGSAATVASLLAGLVASLLLAATARDAAAETRAKLYAAEMIVATTASMDPGRRTRAARLVDKWREAGELRGWEWNLLDAVQRRDVLRLDTREAPVAASWHPSGESIAVAMGESLGIYDADSGEELVYREIDPHGEHLYFTGISWDAAGERLAAAGVSRVLCWVPGDGSDQGTILWEHPLDHTHEVSWHPSRDLVVFAAEGLVGLDSTTGEVVIPEGPKRNSMSGNIFDSTGERVVAFSFADYVLVRDFDDRTPRLRVADETAVVACVDWSPDNRMIALSCTDNVVWIYDTESGENITQIRDHREPVHCVHWHPDGVRLATGAEDGTVRIFDGPTGAGEDVLLRHESRVADVQWSPDGDRLVSVAAGGEALVWRMQERSALRQYTEPRMARNDALIRLQWSTKRRVLIASANGTVVEWPVDARVPGDPIVTNGLSSYSTNGLWTATSDEKVALRIRSLESGAVVEEFELEFDPSFTHDWLPGHDALVTGSAHGIRRFDVGGGGNVLAERIGTNGGSVRYVRCSPDGGMVLYATTADAVCVIDSSTGAAAASVALPEHVGTRAGGWSPDGSRVAVACSDSIVRIADASTGAIEFDLIGHTNQAEAVDWHPREPRIATGGRDRTVKLWDTRTGDLVASFECQAHIADVLWIEGGRCLSAIDIDGTIYVWDASRSLDRMQAAVDRD